MSHAELGQLDREQPGAVEKLAVINDAWQAAERAAERRATESD